MYRPLALLGTLALALPLSGLAHPAVAATTVDNPEFPTHLQYQVQKQFTSPTAVDPTTHTGAGVVSCDQGDPIDHGVAAISADDPTAPNASIGPQGAFVDNTNHQSGWVAFFTLPDNGDQVTITIVCRDDVYTPPPPPSPAA
jgi:hypothetical protein